MKTFIPLLCLLAMPIAALAAGLKPQLALENYVANYASEPVDSPRSLGPFAEEDMAVLFTKCSETVLFVGYRPANFSAGFADGAGATGHDLITGGGDLYGSAADSVANALPRIIATFGARYHITATPVFTKAAMGSDAALVTGYVIQLRPRESPGRFPSDVLRRGGNR